MLGYIARRLLQIIPLVFGLSLVIFVIIQLPPSDYVSIRIRQLEQAGAEVNRSEIMLLTQTFNLDKPVYVQYLLWMRGILLKGDLGRSMQTLRPVTEVIGDRLLMTMAVTLVTVVFTWSVAIPIGIYSATHQYSVFDYLATFIGFLGISVPGFLIALIALFVVFSYSGVALTGLFSPEYVLEPWSPAKFVDLLKHLPLPMVVVGLAGTAGLIRTTRAMMLDELQRQYVVTARSKGVPERTLLFRYPVRVAINPLISTIGWLLPTIISGEALVSIVLNLPTMGPALYGAVMVQDTYLAGGILVITSTLTVIGTLISDVLLAVVDPRIRFGGVTEGT